MIQIASCPITVDNIF